MANSEIAPAMNLRRQHLICTYLLLCLGTTALWLSESENIGPYPVVVATCAVAAFFFTDKLRLMQLPHFVSNCLGLVILFTIFRELWMGSQHTILALGHFLVYLQVVKFFRRKQPTDFIMMYVLSLLQICIGCIVTPQLIFGVVLFSYIVLGIWTLVLFELCRPNWEQAERAASSEIPRLRLAGTAACLGLVALPVTLLVFWSAPRAASVKFDSIQAPSSSPQSLTTGLGETVDLDEDSTIQEDADVVFRFRCFDKEGNPKTPSSNLLWRSSVFTLYIANKGRWRLTPDVWASNRSHRFARTPPDFYEVMFEVTLPKGADFGLLGPEDLVWAQCERDVGVIRQQEQEGLLQLTNRQADLGGEEDEVFVYRAAVSSADQKTQQLDWNYRLATQMKHELQHVEKLARELTSDLEKEDVTGKIRAIMQYLNSSKNFNYSLDLRRVNRSIDPVEDFLLNMKQGHCEYFASSLALLLRSAGVSARVVNGFKGWDFNPSTQQYEVRQLHAHAWVEAYLPDEQQWWTLDPSPALEREAAVDRARKNWFSWERLTSNLSGFWTEYVVTFSSGSQRRLVDSAILQFRQIVHAIRQKAKSLILWGQSPKSAPGAARLIGLVISAVGAAVVAAMVLGRWRRRRRQQPQAARPKFEGLPLYEDWLDLLERRGFIPQPQQTAQEFARVVESAFQQQNASSDGLPTAMARLYYQARFGNVEVHEDELTAMRNRIQQFEHA